VQVLCRYCAGTTTCESSDPDSKSWKRISCVIHGQDVPSALNWCSRYRLSGTRTSLVFTYASGSSPTHGEDPESGSCLDHVLSCLVLGTRYSYLLRAVWRSGRVGHGLNQTLERKYPRHPRMRFQNELTSLADREGKSGGDCRYFGGISVGLFMIHDSGARRSRHFLRGWHHPGLSELMIFTIHVYFFRFCTDGTK
jgi:hypothetical protein